METPVSALHKIDNGNYAFLLESVEGGENIAQYSFLGSNPSLTFQTKNDTIKTVKNGVIEERTGIEDPFGELKKIMDQFRPVNVEGLPRFHGGAVGFISYDMVRYFENLPDSTSDDFQLPDCFFMLTDTILVFDHVNHKIKVVSNAHLDGEKQTVDEAYGAATEQIEEIISLLKNPMEYKSPARGQWDDDAVKSNFTPEEYEKVVEAAKEYIKAGDIVQVVPSQRLSVPIKANTFDIYRALRTVNPLPYMYYF